MNVWDRDTHSDLGDGAHGHGHGHPRHAKPTHDPDAPIEGSDGSELLLKTSGSLMEMRAPAAQRHLLFGLMRSVRNHPHRGKQWPITLSAANARGNQFAIADARGQVFLLDADKNRYHAVRLASCAVSALGFVTSRVGELIVAYENGSVLVIDTDKRDIVGNLQQQGGSAVRMIRAHPNKVRGGLGFGLGHCSGWT